MKSVHQGMILSFVKRIAWHLRMATLLERALVLLTTLLIALLLSAGLLPIATTMPLLATGLILLVLGAIGSAAAWLIWACLQRYSLEAVALHIEGRHPHLHNDLISAIQLPGALEQHPEAGISRALVDRLMEVTGQQIETLQREALVDWRGVTRQLRVVVPLLIAMLGMGWFAPEHLRAAAGHLMHPFSFLASAHPVLTLGDYPQRILRGQSLTVHVQASGASRPEVRLRSWRDGREREDLMVASGQDGFRHTFTDLRQSLRFQAVAGGVTSGVGEVEVVDPPAVGNFRLRYQYPDYSRLPPKIEEGTGHLEALAGSEVRIEMAANKPIAEGRLVFDDNTQLPLIVRADGMLQATAIITKPGGYRVQVQDEHGFTNQENPYYRIDVIPDAPPHIDLLAPEPDMEIEEGRVIALEYEARDDFGVRELALVYRLGPVGERRLVIDRVDEVPRRYRGRYHWDITDLFRGAGEVITYYLEVWDNDTVSGPKRGVSATHVLRIKSLEEEHRRLDEMQQQVAEKLIDLLADQLDLNSQTTDMLQTPAPPDPMATEALETRQAELQRQAQELLAQLDEMLRTLEKDYLSDYTRYEDTRTLRDTLNFTQDTLMGGARQHLSPQASRPPPGTQTPRSPQRQGPQSPDKDPPALDQALAKQEAAQGELERMALFAQEIGKRAKMHDLENLAQRMARTQRNLLDALTDLERLGREIDATTHEALEKELRELEKAMRSLMEALSKLPSELPDEFLNSEALQHLQFGDMLQTLQQLREQLAQGNLAEARRLAEDLLGMLSQMLAALQSAQRFAQSMPFGQQQSGMERSLSELDKIVLEQSQILHDTNAVDKSLRQRVNEQQRLEFERLQQEVRNAVQAAQRRLREASQTRDPDNRRAHSVAAALQRTGRALDQVLRQLSPEESEGLLRALRDATQEVAALQGASSPAMKELWQHDPDLKRTLESLGQSLQQAHQHLAHLSALDGHELLDPQQHAELGRLAERQGALQDRTGALKARLDQLSQFIPFLSPELRQKIGEAAEFMGEAQGELGQRRVRQAIPPEEEALRRLAQGQQGMQQAMQQMAQRGQMGQIPVPMVLRRPGDPFAFNQQPFPNRSEREQGRMGINTRDFKIPGKEEYKAPRQFREEIMEALKRGTPSQFKGQIEQYFKNLTE